MVNVMRADLGPKDGVLYPLASMQTQMLELGGQASNTSECKSLSLER